MKTAELTFLILLFMGLGEYSGFSQNHSIRFDGNNDYAEVVNSSLFNFGTTDFTIECWFLAAGYFSGPYSGAISKIGNSEHYYELIPKDYGYAHPVFRFSTGDGQEHTAVASSNIEDGVWHLLCGVRQSNTIYIYIDGVVKGQTDLPLNSTADNTGSLILGTHIIYPSTPVVTYEDEVRIWSRALTPAEILAEVNCGLTGNENGLIGYWRFNEGTGTTAYDQTSHGNNGTLTNGPVWSHTSACHSVTTFAEPANGGTTSGDGNFLFNGPDATVVAAPYPGWEFRDWTYYGNVVSTSPSYQFPVIDDMTLNANFLQVQKELNLKLFLEGLYNGNGTMRQAYNENGVEFGDGIADQITIELHDSATYATVIHAATNAELRTNGTSKIMIPAEYNGSYYITIRHRNGITTTSAAPVAFLPGTVFYDFSDSSDKAYEGNTLQKEEGIYVFYGGDVNQDGIVDGSDMAAVDNRTAVFASGYLAEDCNGDGLIDGSDMSIIDNNAAGYIGSVSP